MHVYPSFFEKNSTTHLRLSAEYSGYYGDRIIVPSDHPDIAAVVMELLDEHYHPKYFDALVVSDAAQQLRESILETYDIDRQTLSEDDIINFVMERRNLTTKKYVSREEHDEFKNACLRNEEHRMRMEGRAEQREARKEEREAIYRQQQQEREAQQQEREARKEEREVCYREQQNELLGVMTSKLVNHDQQLAYLNSNAVMKDQHRSDMEKLERKITDSEMKMQQKIDQEMTKKIQPRSLDFGGSGSLSASSPVARSASPPASPFTFKAPSNSQPAASRRTFMFNPPDAHPGAPFPSPFYSSSNSQSNSQPTLTFKAPDAHLGGGMAALSSSTPPTTGPPFRFQAPGARLEGGTPTALGPPFQFQAPGEHLGGGTASVPSGPPFQFQAPPTPTASGPPFQFQAPGEHAPGEHLGGGTASLLSSSATAVAGKLSTETQPEAQFHDSKITAVDPSNLFDVLSQIELPTVQGGSTSNIIVTDDNAPTIAICPTEPIIFPVRARPFRSTLPAQAAPSIQDDPLGNVMNMPAQDEPSGNSMNMPQPSLFAQFGAPKGWECENCRLRNVEGLEVCIYCNCNRN